MSSDVSNLARLEGPQAQPWIPGSPIDHQSQLYGNHTTLSHVSQSHHDGSGTAKEGIEAIPTAAGHDEAGEMVDDASDTSDTFVNPTAFGRSNSTDSSTSRHHGHTNKRARLSSGSISTPRSAGRPRRVDADLNSDDELIYNMKERGYKDEIVRDELIRQGRVRYVAKTISTRYGRIKRSLEARETAELDAELTDWHDGDDELLEASYAEVIPGITEQRDALERKMWSEVATVLKRHMSGKARFSKNACRDRYTALQDGTAEPPLEHDPDQDGRLARRAHRQLSRSKARAEVAKKAELTAEEAVVKKAEEALFRSQRVDMAAERAQRAAEKRQQQESMRASRAAEQEAKLAMAEAKEYQKARKVTLTEHEREAKKREAAALKIEKQREKEAQNELKKVRNAADKAEKAREKLKAAEDKMKKIEAEQNIKDIMHRRMGQALARSRACSAAPILASHDAGGRSGEECPSPSRLFSRGTRDGMAPPPIRWHPATASTDAGSVVGDAVKPRFERDESVCGRRESSCERSDSRMDEVESIEVPNFARPNAPPADPRSTLSRDNLQALCRERKMPVSGSAEKMVARLAEADQQMHINQLKADLKKRGVSGNGSKAELIYRSAACDAGLWVNPGRGMGHGRRRGQYGDED